MNPSEAEPPNGSPGDRRALLARMLEQRSGQRRAHPVSFAQQRLWFLDQLTPGNPFYNVAIAVRLNVPIEVSVLDRCLNEIVRRHESLRTTFGVVDGQPVQIVSPEARLSLAVVDLRALPPEAREGEALRLAQEDAGRPFDLATGPLLRASLLRLGPADHLFLLSQHHIISDGWSMGIFSRELTALYTAFAYGRPSPLPEPSLQYSDFAVWQRRWLRGETLDRQLEFWTRALSNPPILRLPTDRSRPPAQSYRGATHTFHGPRALALALKRLSESGGVTLFIATLTAFEALLVRYTRQEDLVVGTYIANRNRAELEGIIGFFVNTLVLRTDASGSPTFRELLGRVRESALAAYAHQDLPFEMLVEKLQPDRDLGLNPLFQVVFQMPTGPTASRSAPGESAATTLLDVKPPSAIFDLSVSLWESGAGLTAQMEYSCDLFDPPTIERMAAHYLSLLEAMAADPDQPISKCNLLTPDEERLLLTEWNGERESRPDERSVVERLEDQAARTPESIAFEDGEASITIAELHRRARRLAGELRRHGVNPEEPVGVCLERGLDVPVALFAIWMVGGVYLPLDPSYPAARLASMAVEARVQRILSRASLRPLCPSGATLILVDQETAEPADPPPPSASSRIRPDQLAYVIFTSGSTGQPKGVAVEHRQILNRLAWMWEEYPFEPGEVGCQKTSLNFVDSLWEWLGPLLRGIPTVIVPDEIVRDPWSLIDLLNRRRVTRLWLVPSLLRAMLDTGTDLAEQLPHLRFWVSSGEALGAELYGRFTAQLPAATLFNLYGTSETWDVTWFDPRREPPVSDTVPIGRPLPNLEVYVLDGERRPTPMGVPGELWVGGDGLARGYLHQPGLTAERFAPHPFSSRPGARLYRTGDLARFRADGNLEFLGRLDQQLKIRGYRVEPAEVENVLATHPSLGAAVVSGARDASGEADTLVAFLIPRNGDDLGAIDWGAWLGSRIPAHLVPPTFRILESLPLLPNGKVDRDAIGRLGAPEPARKVAYAPPQTPTEVVMARLWTELFKARPVGVHDHFFRDLGGHSLMATQLVSRIRDEFRVELPLRCLFQSPTVGALALEVDRLRSAPVADGPALVPLPRNEYRIPTEGPA